MVNDKVSEWVATGWTDCGESQFSIAIDGHLVITPHPGVELTIVREKKLILHQRQHFLDIFLTETRGLHENTIGLIGNPAIHNSSNYKVISFAYWFM